MIPVRKPVPALSFTCKGAATVIVKVFVALDVAFFEIAKVVELVTDEIYVLACIPVPVTNIPATRALVLPEVVTVSRLLVVVQDSVNAPLLELFMVLLTPRSPVVFR